MGRAVSWFICISSMRGSKQFCQSGSNSLFFAGGGGGWGGVVDEGNDDPITTKSGSSPSRQRNAILVAFRWRPMVAQHLMLTW